MKYVKIIITLFVLVFVTACSQEEDPFITSDTTPISLTNYSWTSDIKIYIPIDYITMYENTLPWSIYKDQFIPY